MSLREELQEQLNKEALQKDKQALKELLNSENGRWFLTRLFFRLDVTPALEPLAMAKAEGRRAVMRDLKAEVDSYFGGWGRGQLLKGQQEALEMEQRYEIMWKEQQYGRRTD